MKLLDPKIVKEEKGRIEAEQEARIFKLRQEEGVVVARLNAALAAEAVEKKRIAEDLLLARNEAETEVKKSVIKKSVLLQEIKAIETKKAEALKPIHDIQKQTQELFESAKQTIADLTRRENLILADEQNLQERMESIIEREEEVLEKVRALDKREVKIRAAEEEIKRSTDALGKSWVAFHDEVYRAKDELRGRQAEIDAQKSANENYRKSLDARSNELDHQQIAIKDAFGELEKSREAAKNT